MLSIRKRLVVIGSVVATAQFVFPGAAFGHVEPNPAKVAKASLATIGFRIPHGCAGSPTISIAIKLPAGVTNPSAVAKSGWTVGIKDGIVTFSGGMLAAKTPATFSIRATMPSAPTNLAFPTVQKCVKGETDWIEKTVTGQPEPEHPAPVVRVI